VGPTPVAYVGLPKGARRQLWQKQRSLSAVKGATAQCFWKWPIVAVFASVSVENYF